MIRAYLVQAATFVAATAAALLLSPAPAQACGGTFCDAGPQAMPVDQTGENILFVMEGSYTEAHIQIQYDPNTDADKFAWVIPLQAIPEFSVGSQPLFDNLLSGSVPRYGFNSVFDDCGDPGETAGDPSTGGDSGGAFISEPDGGGTGTDVLFEDTVGAFEVVVLQSGTSAELIQWLDDNGYQQDPEAEPIFNEYLGEGYLFAAFKLTTGADIAEIHPVVLRFDTNEACVPIRLTRIAAKDDMEVRTFFLADDRVVPRNYRHVLVNPLKIDWPNFADNYKAVITLAVDAAVADGKAFVTEYAGPSDVVSNAGLHSASWDSGPFAGLDPTLVIQTLQQQEILFCEQGFCEFYHPLIGSLLGAYLPVPDGVTLEDFYGCLTCYAALIDQNAWDGAAFGAAYQERIIDPGAYALDLLSTWPQLTRMYTTISPGEMTEDPFFHTNSFLPDVTNLQTATRRVLCNGDAVWQLPDTREVYLPQGSDWPAFSDEMPWEEEIEEMPSMGAGLTLVDNTERIDELLSDYNAAHGWPAGEDSGDGGSGGSDGSTGSAGGSGDSDSAGGGGSGSSCACRSAVPGLGDLWLVGLFALGAIGMRKRQVAGRSDMVG